MSFFRRNVMLVVIAAAIVPVRRAHAGPFDLEDEDDAKDKPKAEPAQKQAPEPIVVAPIATIKGHAYSLDECLLLADRNHPNLWAARARLAVTHAQLDEARWT